MIRYGSMFSGGVDAGWVSLSLLPFNVRNCFAIENDKFNAQLLRLNAQPELLIENDVENVGLDLLPKVDLFLCTPPRAPFSSLGNAGEDDPRRSLWYYGIEYITYHMPRIFIFENVTRFASSKECDDLLRRIPSQYTVDRKILDASEHGSLQVRKRLFIVGKLECPKIVWPTPCMSSCTLGSILEENVNEKFFYSEKALAYLARRSKWGTPIHDENSRSMPTFCKNFARQIHWKHTISDNGRLRKMTPREIIRLFGIPDFFCTGKLSDYRVVSAVGNSMDTHVVEKLLFVLLSTPPWSYDPDFEGEPELIYGA